MPAEIYKYDPSGEQKNYVAPGVQHKYRETALIFVAQECHSICDWCFRKRLFEGQCLSSDKIAEVGPTVDYLTRHPEIRSVLLSGGDALLAEPEYLHELVREIERIDHIQSIRIGSRALVHDANRYLDRIPRDISKRTFVVLHIVRPEEVRPDLIAAVNELPDYTFLTQSPLLAGINDDPEVLSGLWYDCVSARIQPYYVFQCRPTTGNERFALSFRDGHDVFAGAQSRCTGVVKTPRWVMSNSTGKWEILAIEQDEAVLRCHQCIDPDMVGEIRRGPADDFWWDLPREDSRRGELPTLLAHRHASGA